MKKFKISIIFLQISLIFLQIAGFAFPVFASQETKLNNNKDYVEGEIIVKYKNSSVNLEAPNGALKALGIVLTNDLEVKENFNESNISVLEITDDKTVEEKIIELESDPNIEYAEPNFIRYPSVINTNDAHKDLLWGLDNISQTINGATGTIDADIDMPEAWAINEGTNASVIVAVLDTGVAYNHPDLAANMWDGTNCKSDTGAFLGGCLHGYDYLDNDKDPVPAGTYYVDHGTHVSGTIAAVKNNSKGIIGVAPNAKIMALRFSYTVASEVKAINFARQNGAKIINASFGGGSFSQSEFDVINLFRQAGGIFVAAAANYNSNNDFTPIYPANYDLDNIISVAATDSNDNLATFSNYGLTNVDVAAPGVNILSTLSDTTGGLEENYGYSLGTSMATPHVAGLAALIWGTKPILTTFGVKDIILNTGDSLNSLSGKTVSGKRINAFNALSILSSTSVTVTYSDTDKIVKVGDNIVISANFNEPVQDSPVPKISITGSNTLAPVAMTKVSNVLYTYNYVVGSGDGIGTVSILDALTQAGGLSIVSAPASGSTFIVDNIAPTLTLSAPSSSSTKNGPISYIATYTGASSLTLSPSDVVLNTTGTATGTISVTGSGNTTRAITISNITGDGTLGISILADTATDIAGNKALAYSPSEVFTVDNTIPTNQDTVFSASVIKKGGEVVNIISSGDINNNIWFSIDGINEFIESTVRTKAIDGTSLSILSPSREGVYKLFIVDRAGNISAGSVATLTVDNTVPAIPVITSVAENNQISYEERNAIHVIGLAEANSLVTVTLGDGTNTKSGTQQLGDNNINFDVVIDGTTALPAALLDGTINISVTSSDKAGNTSTPVLLSVIKYPQVKRSSGGGGGGGGSSTSTTPVAVLDVPVTTPILNIVIPGCTESTLFSPLTGARCGTVSSPQTISNINNLPSSILSITKVLKQGVKGDDVKILQTYLNTKGYDCGIPDGAFGPKTKRAVILFQIANKLTADGIVGAMTRGKME